MSKRAIARTAPATPARVVYYTDPAPHADLVYYNPRQLAARRRAEAEQYARWEARQLAIAERDRKVRRFMLGFGAVVGTGFLAGLGVVGWMVWHALAGLSATVGLAAFGVAAVLGAGALVVGGHKCITVVKHWH
jgi:hypothetical protein